MAGVVATHDALQLGEFAHHIGEQIGLGQAGGGVHLRCQRVATKLLRDALGNRAHALTALALRAQLVVINHLGQPRHAGLQRFLAVLIEEEFGIRQARAHHALVALNHRARVRRTDVADHEELVRQLARCVQQGEVFLIGLHREDEAFLRHFKELLFKLADEDVGAFNEGRYFVE